MSNKLGIDIFVSANYIKGRSIMRQLDRSKNNKTIGRLSEKEHWQTIYKSIKEGRGQSPSSLKERQKKLFKKIFGDKIFNYLREYYQYLFLEICKKYLPKTKGLKAIEIGSGTAESLVEFCEIFDYIPYGVEYSEEGVELGRKTFLSHHISPHNIIYSDFFSDEFQKNYQEYFDVVISRGFIEHFSNAKEVIKKHINLLKKDGFLIIGIPNVSGVNYFLKYFFHRESIEIYNLEIISKKSFLELFSGIDIITLYCNYYGTFNFGLFGAGGNVTKQYILYLCRYLQLMLNLFFRILFKDKGKENKYFSPYLIYVGRKKSF